jgi:hypothetical protein
MKSLLLQLHQGREATCLGTRRSSPIFIGLFLIATFASYGLLTIDGGPTRVRACKYVMCSPSRVHGAPISSVQGRVG